MGQPLVTVVIPTYDDDPEHLAEAVASVRAQTYPRVELVVVDDGSHAPVRLDGVRVIRQDNAGVATARNTGIRATTGEVVICLDADDRLSPTYAAEAVEVLADPGVTIAYARMEKFGAIDETWFRGRTLTLADFSQRSAVPATSAFRRSDWERAGGWDETMRTGMEDHEWWVRLLGECGGTCRPMVTAVVHCRVRPGSRSRARPYADDLAVTRERMTAAASRETALTLLAGSQAYADALERRVAELERSTVLGVARRIKRRMSRLFARASATRR